MNARPTLHSLSRLGVFIGLGLRVTIGGLALAAPPRPTANGPAPGSSGSIVITDHQLNPALSSFQKDLRSEAKTTLAKNPDSDTWKIHFIAYLNHATSEDVNVVFYDPEPLKPGQTREPIQAYPLHTKSNAKIVISQLDLKPEEGFKPGGKYQVLVTRLLTNGKEDVYARGSIELTDKEAAK